MRAGLPAKGPTLSRSNSSELAKWNSRSTEFALVPSGSPALSHANSLEFALREFSAKTKWHPCGRAHEKYTHAPPLWRVPAFHYPTTVPPAALPRRGDACEISRARVLASLGESLPRDLSNVRAPVWTVVRRVVKTLSTRGRRARATGLHE